MPMLLLLNSRCKRPLSRAIGRLLFAAGSPRHTLMIDCPRCSPGDVLVLRAAPLLRQCCPPMMPQCCPQPCHQRCPPIPARALPQCCPRCCAGATPTLRPCCPRRGPNAGPQCSPQCCPDGAPMLPECCPRMLPPQCCPSAARSPPGQIQPNHTQPSLKFRH